MLARARQLADIEDLAEDVPARSAGAARPGSIPMRSPAWPRPRSRSAPTR